MLRATASNSNYVSSVFENSLNQVDDASVGTWSKLQLLQMQPERSCRCFICNLKRVAAASYVTSSKLQVLQINLKQVPINSNTYSYCASHEKVESARVSVLSNFIRNTSPVYVICSILSFSILSPMLCWGHPMITPIKMATLYLPLKYAYLCNRLHWTESWMEEHDRNNYNVPSSSRNSGGSEMFWSWSSQLRKQHSNMCHSNTIYFC